MRTSAFFSIHFYYYVRLFFIISFGTRLFESNRDLKDQKDDEVGVLRSLFFFLLLLFFSNCGSLLLKLKCCRYKIMYLIQIKYRFEWTFYSFSISFRSFCPPFFFSLFTSHIQCGLWYACANSNLKHNTDSLYVFISVSFV